MSILKRVSPVHKERPAKEKTPNTLALPKPKTSLSDLVEPERPYPSLDAPQHKKPKKLRKKKKPESKARSGSPLLKRKFRVSVALSIPEYEIMHHAAQARHMTISSLLRHAIFEGLGLPRPHPDKLTRVGQARALDEDA